MSSRCVRRIVTAPPAATPAAVLFRRSRWRQRTRLLRLIWRIWVHRELVAVILQLALQVSSGTHKTTHKPIKLWARPRSRCQTRGMIPGSFLYHPVTAVSQGVQRGLACYRRQIRGRMVDGIAMNPTLTSHQKDGYR
ncbi:hypothetical protein LY78DRAFT_17357 [Colletotrichum sublineola]|nr:hypothetical protein LY78DRAFT_17357 [Colletotrichum sublineola]